MAKTDIPVKRLMQLRPEDWIKAVTGEVQNISFSEVKPDKNPKPKTESRLDNLYEVEIKDQIFLLNIEPQGYQDPALPARMLRYRADIYESFMSKNHKILPIRQTVIYFSTSNKITDNKIIDSTFKTSNINYSYEEIGVWDMNKSFIIENELYGI